MSSNTSRTEFHLPSSFKGKYVGVFILVVFQVFVGAIHVIFGPALLASSNEFLIYGVYTFLYGVIVAASAYGMYTGRLWGWMGNLAFSMIVIIVDVFTVLSVPLIPGVPKFAATGEIPYSVAVIVYLVQPKIIKLYAQKKED